MTMPVIANTKCDLYRNGNSPPANPDVAGIPIQLRPAWVSGQESGDRPGLTRAMTFTHVAYCDSAADVRDAYTGDCGFVEQDSIYVPDQSGTKFRVVFVELVGRSLSNEHFRLWLDRQQPNWPTHDL